MTDGRQAPSEGAPACGTLVALGACAFVAGLALGLTQPLVFFSVGPGIVAGATYVGLLFLLCLVLALVMIVLAFFGARWLTVPAFVASGSLALGLLAGNWTAATFDIGSGSSRPVVVTPSLGPPPSIPTHLEVPATAVHRLGGDAGQASRSGELSWTGSGWIC